ncbi:MAG: ComF family protein [Firmicutes bacterium]|nr:ComF family protein [Bacillota bacterium]
MRELLRVFLAEVDQAIFPSSIYCVCCGALIDRTRSYSLCDSCIDRFHWITGRTCEKCGKAMPETSRGRLCYDCMQLDHFFRKGFSCLTYGLYERQLMMDLKYAGKGYLARIFGNVMYDRVEGEDLDIDLIVPVSVSQGRLRKRGYNQSLIMARQLADRWKREREHAPSFCPGMLRRAKETKMLRSLNPTERRMVLQGAFLVNPSMKQRLEGRSVLIVDDIYTTGATADACSLALLEGGASEVYLLTLASGGNRRPSPQT